MLNNQKYGQNGNFDDAAKEYLDIYSKLKIEDERPREDYAVMLS